MSRNFFAECISKYVNIILHVEDGVIYGVSVEMQVICFLWQVVVKTFIQETFQDLVITAVNAYWLFICLFWDLVVLFIVTCICYVILFKSCIFCLTHARNTSDAKIHLQHQLIEYVFVVVVFEVTLDQSLGEYFYVYSLST